MPNHCHVIYQIRDNDIRRGTLQRAPTPISQNTKFSGQTINQPQIEQFGKPTSNSIPTIVRLTKSTITKQINIIRNKPGAKVWQRNYYEHIIRNSESLYSIKQYIRGNPMCWENDYENHINHEIDTFGMVEIEEF
jgi:REP element-mobilizing transposase RayT